MTERFRITANGLQLCLKVQPGASRNAVEGWIQDANGEWLLKVRINAPPEDGKANKEALRFLAKEWGIPKSALEIVRGETARVKQVRIAASSAETVAAKLSHL